MASTYMKQQARSTPDTILMISLMGKEKNSGQTELYSKVNIVVGKRTGKGR